MQPLQLYLPPIVIVKATDENLTSEDWGAIIDLCDKVSSDPNGPNQAVQGLIKRLAHRNANVQLYTLEVSRGLWETVGDGEELSSRHRMMSGLIASC